jgi:cobalt-zinc-cadmium efflux system outer membrane protein
MMHVKRVLGIFLLYSTVAGAQQIPKDTLRLTLKQADSTLINRNLSLLAEKCNIDASRALIIQAGVFNNPSFTVNQSVYNTEYQINGGRKWFDFSNNGETNFQIEQLFYLAGKRNKRIKLAELTADREEAVYFDLVRSLKFSMRSSFYNIYFLGNILSVYNKEITSLSKLISVESEQYEKGYFSKKELLRLKTLLFTIQNEKLGFQTQLITAQTEFNVFMRTDNEFYIPLPIDNPADSLVFQNLKLQALIDTAYQHRFDLKTSRSELQINQMNLSYQKSLAVPDITLSGGWDRNGSYVHNYNFIGLQMDLPWFNRNQGNIRSARSDIQAGEYKVQGMQDRVKADVIEAYASALETNNLYSKYDGKFKADVERLTEEMQSNYEKKNISLIEFLDYYDAFKQNAVQVNNLLYSRIVAFENINYSVGKDIVLIH